MPTLPVPKPGQPPPVALVTGASGQVGGHLARLLLQKGWEVLAPGPDALDLNQPDALTGWLAGRRFDLTCHAAAYTQVDLAEAHPEDARRVNVLATQILSDHTQSTGGLLLTFGTDYVFTDWPHPGQAIPETATPSPRGVYASTKREAELAALSHANTLVVRTSGVYDPAGVNFVAAILSRLVKEGSAQVVNDQFTVPTPAGPLAAWSLAALEKGARGLLHLVPSGAPCWFDVASVTSEVFARRTGRAVTVSPTTTAAFVRPAPRPAWSVLDNTLAREKWGLDLPGWRALLVDALKDWPLPGG